jgi:Ca2+-binding RTX toxin-like protein
MSLFLGTSGADEITPALNTVGAGLPGSGADTLQGAAGADTLDGGGGDDLVQGGADADNLQGGAGNDTLSHAGETVAVVINLGTGAASGGSAAGDTIAGFEAVTGSLQGDSLTGGAGSQTLDGGGGSDTLVGGLGADLLVGSSATFDYASYAASSAAVHVDMSDGLAEAGGDAEGDTLVSLNFLVGSAFADTLVGGPGAGGIGGGDGNDIIRTGDGSGEYDGGDGDDLMEGNAFPNAMGGGAGNDTLRGFDGGDYLVGGAGTDVIEGGEGADRLDGSTEPGAGADTVSYASDTVGVMVDLGAMTASGGHAQGDTITNFEAVVGGSGADTLIGTTSGDLALKGGGGDDSLVGLTGRDLLDGGDGADTINSNDTIHDDVVIGGAGGDLLTGNSLDLLIYSGSSEAVHIDLAAGIAEGGDAEGDTLSGFAFIFATDFADTLIGGAGNETLCAFDGDDLLQGGAGGDYLTGGSPSFAGAEDGADTVSYAADTVGVMVDLGAMTASGGEAAGDSIFGFDAIIGGRAADTLRGSSGDDTLEGGNGKDRVDAGDGNDLVIRGGLGGTFDPGATLEGGSGADTIHYQAPIVLNLGAGTAQQFGRGPDSLSGFEVVVGSSGYDILGGGAGSETLYGGGGGDVFTASGGGDLLVGESFDVYQAGTTPVRIALDADGDAVTQPLSGLADTLVGFDALFGGAGADTLSGNAANNILAGNAGDDLLAGGGGYDAIDGGTGADTLSYAAETIGVLLDLGADSASSAAWAGPPEIDTVFDGLVPATIGGIEYALGGSGGDTLIAGALGVTLDGGLGNDRLASGASNDSLQGGAGADTVDYGSAEDDIEINLVDGFAQVDSSTHRDTIAGFEAVIGSAHHDTIVAGAGSQTLMSGGGGGYLVGGAGADMLVGTAAVNPDIADYRTSSAAVRVNLADGLAEAGGDAAGDTLVSIDGAFGSAGADTLTGDGGNNLLYGNTGNDQLRGGAGLDFLMGYDDDDLVEGGADGDILDGGAGSDTLSYAGDTVGVFVDLASGILLGGHAAGDTVTGFEALAGGDGGDTLLAAAKDSTVSGGDGNDIVHGGIGNDLLSGGRGADTVSFEGTALDLLVDLSTSTLGGPGAGADSISGFEAVVTGDGGDTLIGSNLRGTLWGGIGNDVATGGTTHDQIYGQAGSDTLAGGAGSDTLHGGAGNDSVSGEDGNDLIIARGGADTLRGGQGFDTYIVNDARSVVIEEAGAGSGVDEVIAEVDYVLGDNIERLRFIDATDLDGTGNALSNRVVGNDGVNLLRGMGANDLVIAGLGADTLDGGAGSDRLFGEGGADVFLFANLAEAGDAVGDFASGEDVLMLLAAGFAGLTAGSLDGALTAGGTARFIQAADGRATAEAGEWQFIFSDASSVLVLDDNGIATGGRTVIARLQGAALTAADIVIA